MYVVLYGLYKYTATGKKSHRIEIDGRRQLSEPEPYTGCSTSKEDSPT
jgi:hypothetical protein